MALVTAATEVRTIAFVGFSTQLRATHHLAAPAVG